MKKTNVVAIPVLCAVLAAAGWGWVWYRPQREAVAQLRRQIPQLQDRIVQLQSEVTRAEAADLSVPVESAQKAEQRWADVLTILERAGFAVERIEFSSIRISGGPPPSGPTGPTPSPPARGEAPPRLPTPSGAAPGGPGPAVADGSQGADGVPQIVNVRISLRFKGDYLRLRQALEEAARAVPGLGWTRLDMNSQGNGVVTVSADATIVALAGAAR